MNMQTPIKTLRQIKTFDVSTVEVLRLSELPDCVAEARRYGLSRFNGEYVERDHVEAELESAKKCLRILERDLRRAERRKRRAPESRSWRTGKMVKPLSRSQIAKIAVGIAFLMLDGPVLVYVLAQYVVASGAIETLADGIWAAVPFTLLLLTAIAGLKALGETYASEEERERFAANLLRIGWGAAACFAVAFAWVFNPATIQPAALGAGSGLENLMAPVRIGLPVAAVLVFTQIVASVAFGAGLALSVSGWADRNKALHTEPCAGFAAACREVEELTAQRAALEAEITDHTAYLNRFEATRDRFVEALASRVATMRDRVAAKRRAAYHAVTQEIVASSATAETQLSH